MAGKRATFYLVPVTSEPSMAGATREYPAGKTVVSMCGTVTGALAGASDGMGMAVTEYRRVALERFLAFRMLARGCWGRFWMVW
jgi:hypothetical protein